MSTNLLANLDPLLNDFVVYHLRADSVASFVLAHPCAQVLSHAICGLSIVYCNSQVALSAESSPFAEIFHECFPIGDPEKSRAYIVDEHRKPFQGA